jgi:GNAT superfamily N-acetyltransferase
MTTVTVTYLEMTDPAQLVPADPVPDSELSIVEARVPSAELSRSLYEAVGRPWYWTERLDWTIERWKEWLEDAGVRTWLATHGDAPAGYFQLTFAPDGEVEIAYFGMLGEFVGRGWGGWLLTCAVRQAWSHGASRVWLHTCTLDHPAALPNYRKRGFVITGQRTEERSLAGR